MKTQLTWEQNFNEMRLDAFWHKYSGQTNPQTVHLTLDLRSGEASFEVDANVGSGVSGEVYHGLVQTWVVPSGILPREAKALLNSLRTPLQMVLDGSSIELDRQSNYVGRLDEAGRDAYLDIEQSIDNDAFETVAVWDAEDWFVDYTGDLLEDGETVEQAAERYEAEALDDEVVLVGTEEYIRERLEEE